MLLCRTAARATVLGVVLLLVLLLAALPAGAREAEPAPAAAGVGGLLARALGLGPHAAPQRTVLYEIGTRGDVTADVAGFRAVVGATLSDPRGWSDGGRTLFVPVRRGGDVRIWLATPEAVAAAHPTCSAHYSCRVENGVYINEDRWRDGAATYAARPLSEYRQYVINHELGHWLGLDHRGCRARGASAPVMQQQTIALDGCQPRVWPLAHEQSRARRAADAAGGEGG